VSASDERSALNRPVSLFQYAQGLIRLHPDQPLPGAANPPHAPSKERLPKLMAVLREFIEDPTRSAQDYMARGEIVDGASQVGLLHVLAFPPR